MYKWQSFAINFKNRMKLNCLAVSKISCQEHVRIDRNNFYTVPPKEENSKIDYLLSASLYLTEIFPQ